MHSGTKARHHFSTCVYTNKEAKIPLQYPCTVLEVVIIKQNMLILGGPCSPQGQVRHVADLFRQIRHGNRNKTAKYVLNRLYFVGGGL